MNAVSIAVESAGATLLKALINQIERMPKPWQQIPEKDQEQVIFHMRQAVESAVRATVKRIVAGNFAQIPAEVESVTFKDGVKAVVQLPKGDAGTHTLADKTGGQVMIVLANEEEYFEGMDRVEAEADQPDLFDADDELPDPIVPSESFVELVGEPEDEGNTMGQQTRKLLEKVNVHVPASVAEAWNENECKAAAYWAIETVRSPETAPARPHWLPLPEVILEAHTRVFQSSTALSAYIDVPPVIHAKVMQEWIGKEGVPSYDDFVRAIEAATLQSGAPAEVVEVAGQDAAA